VLQPSFPIKTSRLMLRPLTADDFDDMHAYYSLPEVARYLYWEPCSPDETRVQLDRNMRRNAISEERDGLVLGAVWPEVGRLVGQVSLQWTSREHRQGEIGFIINPAFQRKGLASEAAAAMLELGFDGLGLHRIVARTDARNEGSVRVMERLGMRREAHFRHNEIFKGEWGDEVIHALLDDEWRSRGS
jgi:RimJ/RimL family protein N-acetyltransferase